MALIASIQCHQGDTGGAVPGGYNVTANDGWGEGVRWPVIKAVEAGKERKDVPYTLAANNPLPSFIGDVRAQIGAAQMACDRLGALLTRWGTDQVEASVDYMIDYAARRFREEVAAWPDGSYEADCYVDHDPLGHPDIHLHVKIDVAADRLTIDFAGSDTRPEIQAWSTFGTTRGYTVGQIAATMDPEIPKNEGFFDEIAFLVTLGCVLNPVPGKPVSAGPHHPGAEVGEVIALALQHVLPEKAVPQVHKTGIPTVISGVDLRTGATFTDHSAEVYAGWCNAAAGWCNAAAGWCNAAAGMDAWGCQAAAFGNLWKATAEINESLYPHVQWGRDYRIDSGGPRHWRGLCGSHEERVPVTLREADSEPRIPSHGFRAKVRTLKRTSRRKPPFLGGETEDAARKEKLAGSRRMVTGIRSYERRCLSPQPGEATTQRLRPAPFAA